MKSPARNLEHLWVFDSSASRHICNFIDHYVEFRKLSEVELVYAASIGASAKVVGIGNVKVRQVIDGVEATIMPKRSWLCT